MRNVLIGSAALLLVLSACGGDDDDGGQAADVVETEDSPTSEESPPSEEGEAPLCSDQYAEGEVVTAEDVDGGCLEDDGTLWFGGAAETECVDGRVLKWNDRAWWYEGEGVHPHEPDAEEQVAPLEEREACQP